MWYLQVEDNVVFQILKNFFTFLVLYSPMVPISLYVTLEFVRVFQANFIESDIEMFHEETNTPALARTSNLNEELGQIDYVFSDKTGTLTCNQMVFRVCTIGGLVYGSIPNLASTSTTSTAVSSSSSFYYEPKNKSIEPEYEMEDITTDHAIEDDRAKGFEEESIGSSSDSFGFAPAKTPDIEFDDPQIFHDAKDHSHPNNEYIREFMTVLSVCHTVIPEPITEKQKLAEQEKRRKKKKRLRLKILRRYDELGDPDGDSDDDDEENGQTDMDSK